MKGVCHQLLPIDSYNRYQSNQIYRFLSIDKSIKSLNMRYFSYPKLIFPLK